MKCILCGKRKGKRFCPAKNTQICAQCCGEKRVVEINCPSDCVYLKSGQSYQSVKKYVSLMQQEEDPLRQKKLYETHQKFGGVLHRIEAQIITYAADLSSLGDEHILEAIELVTKTYETEQKGVIYEHTSSNPLVQALSRELRQLLEQLRADTESGFSSLRTHDLLDCLEVVERDIRYHLEAEGEDYLKFIRRNHPEVSSEGSSGGKLIEI